jgi:hypothetical protein
VMSCPGRWLGARGGGPGCGRPSAALMLGEQPDRNRSRRTAKNGLRFAGAVWCGDDE